MYVKKIVAHEYPCGLHCLEAAIHTVSGTSYSPVLSTQLNEKVEMQYTNAGVQVSWKILKENASVSPCRLLGSPIFFYCTRLHF